MVCRQLGYQGGAEAALKSRIFGPFIGPIWLTNLQCIGNGKNVMECAHDKLANKTERSPVGQFASLICKDGKMSGGKIYESTISTSLQKIYILPEYTNVAVLLSFVRSYLPLTLTDVRPAFPRLSIRWLSWDIVSWNVTGCNPGRATQALKIDEDKCCLAIYYIREWSPLLNAHLRLVHCLSSPVNVIERH